MKVLVTGGLGFIGSNFVRLLLHEDRVESVLNLDKVTYAGNPENLSDLEDDPRYLFIKGDLLDGDLLSRILTEYDIQFVLNFAAESHVDRSIDSLLLTRYINAFIQTNLWMVDRSIDSFILT